MEKTILVNVKNVYGQERVYPVTFQKELEVLTSTKTLLTKHIEALKGLGFTFQIEIVKFL